MNLFAIVYTKLKSPCSCTGEAPISPPLGKSLFRGIRVMALKHLPGSNSLAFSCGTKDFKNSKAGERNQWNTTPRIYSSYPNQWRLKQISSPFSKFFPSDKNLGDTVHTGKLGGKVKYLCSFFLEHKNISICNSTVYRLSPVHDTLDIIFKHIHFTKFYFCGVCNIILTSAHFPAFHWFNYEIHYFLFIQETDKPLTQFCKKGWNGIAEEGSPLLIYIWFY